MTWLRKNSFSIVSWFLALLFFAPFLIYPMYRVFSGALIENGAFHPALLLLPWQDFTSRKGFYNSLMVALLALLFSFVVAPVS